MKQTLKKDKALTILSMKLAPVVRNILMNTNQADSDTTHQLHPPHPTLPDCAGEAVRFPPGRALTQNCDLAQMTRSSRFNSSCRPAADNQAGSLMNAPMEPEDVL